MTAAMPAPMMEWSLRAPCRRRDIAGQHQQLGVRGPRAGLCGKPRVLSTPSAFPHRQERVARRRVLVVEIARHSARNLVSSGNTAPTGRNRASHVSRADSPTRGRMKLQDAVLMFGRGVKHLRRVVVRLLLPLYEGQRIAATAHGATRPRRTRAAILPAPRRGGHSRDAMPSTTHIRFSPISRIESAQAAAPRAAHVRERASRCARP